MIRPMTLGVFVSIVLTGCGDVLGPAEVDIPMVENTIKTGILDQIGVKVKVECPSKIDWEVNDTFNCVVTDANTGEVAMAVVTMENDVGDITWQIR